MTPTDPIDPDRIEPTRVLLFVAVPLLGALALVDFWFSFAMNDDIGLAEYDAYLVRLGLAACGLIVLFGTGFASDATAGLRVRAALPAVAVVGASTICIAAVSALVLLG